jgi:hypothetical protein
MPSRNKICKKLKQPDCTQVFATHYRLISDELDSVEFPVSIFLEVGNDFINRDQ